MNLQNQFSDFNASLIESGEDTYQASFRVDESEGRKSQRDQFFKGVTDAIGLLSMSMKKGDAIKVAPLERDKFDGMTDDKFNLGLEFDYSTQTVVSFPYRFGVVTWKSKDTRFYKLGVKVIKAKIK